MLRHAARSLLRQSAQLRGISSSNVVRAEETAAHKAGKEEFLEKFKQVASSTMSPPNFPTDFAKSVESSEAPAGIPDKLTLNFYMPHEVQFKDSKVDLVLLPAQTGDFGVMPGHVPTVASLRPGVLSVHKELDKDVEKWFVSSGFAFVHADSTADICAVEAVKLNDLDPDAVRAGLQEYTAKLASVQAKGDDYETATAQIGVEVFSAMNSALEAK